jgi:hypothetical protein
MQGKELAVETVRRVDDHHQPGWVEAEFVNVEALPERSMTLKAKE